jgi:hydroxypyruvate isomerase
MGNAGEVGLACLPGREAEARATIDEAIKYAKAIGAAYISVMGGRPDPAKLGEARRTYLKVIDDAACAAEAAGLMAVIEPLNPYDVPGAFLNSSKLAAEIIGELGRPNLKLLFDCYHVQIVEGDLTRRLEKLMPIIGHIQIAAVPSRAEPDEGEVAYDRLLPAIEKLGYRGFVAAEYRPRGEVEAGLGWLKAYRDAPVARLAQ